MAASLLVSILCFASTGFSQGQTFNSGSNGSDGALNLTTPGTIIFNPKSFNPPLDPAGDNIFNFTTINIAQGVTVKLSSKVFTGPVYWLASGAVTINGTIDLDGEDGHPISSLLSLRVPAAGGAGGYSGGVGGTLVAGNPSLPAPQPGNGPGGGAAAASPGAHNGGSGTFTGSQYLIPLIGGSGGAGGSDPGTTPGQFGGGGSGGGGGLLIASSVSITYGGTIKANGGNPGGCCNEFGGAGSGGAIRLIAPTISDNSPAGGDGGCTEFGRSHGTLQAIGGGTANTGNYGIIRLEAFDLTKVDIGDCLHSPTPIVSTPFNVALPATSPSQLTVTSINGISINANPFSFPDAVINSSGPVTVNVQAQYIPVGIVPNIIVTSESGSVQTVACSPLAGTLQLSTCSASITFSTGGSRGFVKATWTQ
jgi:hypothetical protein